MCLARDINATNEDLVESECQPCVSCVLSRSLNHVLALVLLQVLLSCPLLTLYCTYLSITRVMSNYFGFGGHFTGHVDLVGLVLDLGLVFFLSVDLVRITYYQKLLFPFSWCHKIFLNYLN